jgi:pimeloyl-ACP methyl ester carboxylesterase
MRTLLLVAIALGCGSSSTDVTPQPTNDAVVEVATDVATDTTDVVDSGPSLPFTLCPSGYTGACAIVDAPLDHDAPDGKKVKLLISRIASTPGATAQIWVLQGGPGGSAADMTQIGVLFGRNVPKLDVYTLEHRGVGASDRLACSGETMMIDTPEKGIAMLKSCATELETKWGKDGLAKFNTTQAARDLGWAIDKVRKPGQKVYVYGVSYGTYWALRYLQVRGEQPDAVILDSVVTPGVQFISQFEEQYDWAIQKLAELCKADSVCKAHMGEDPLAKAKSLVADIKADKCAAAGPKEQLYAQARFLLIGGNSNTMFFPLLYRYGRCAAGDVAAIKKLDTQLKGFPMSNKFSIGLNKNIVYSELWEDPPPSVEVMKTRSDSIIPGDLWYETELQAAWPKYPHDKYVNALPKTTKPVLLMNGTLDCQTPIEKAEKAKPAFMGANQLFVTFPWANHTVLNTSAMIDPERTCGQEVAFSFLTEGTPDASCAPMAPRPSFTPDPGMVSFFFGRDNAWDDPSSAPMTKAPPALPPDMERSIRDALSRFPYRSR